MVILKRGMIWNGCVGLELEGWEAVHTVVGRDLG
jgi:hypothetical protein